MARATGFAGGTAQGRHTFAPWFPGSPRVWSDEALEKLNEPKYEYGGEKLTEYEARQKERYFDRNIQRWRREEVAMKAAGLDASEAQGKVRAWERRKSDFVLNRTALLPNKNEVDKLESARDIIT